MASSKSDILTLKEVADYMRVNTATIYRLVRSGKIPAFRVGNRWRFRQTSIDEWLTTREGNLDEF
ncbi:MAG: helix-turn-helix domain-containing protein [Candidatus Schekmanbacteria bacterium]|nr:helix-turn-helix domain-containing protein [Candidatus Schekmanbacteria bacterium]